jgi:hypothetical protein
MANKTNPRRRGKRHTEHGPTWEGGPSASGCNSTHIARARRKWKRRANRSERRNGYVTPKFSSMARIGSRRPARPEIP